jgi:hypothetical protein
MLLTLHASNKSWSLAYDTECPCLMTGLILHQPITIGKRAGTAFNSNSNSNQGFDNGHCNMISFAEHHAVVFAGSAECRLRVSPPAGVKHAIGHAHAQPKGPLPQADPNSVHAAGDHLLLRHVQRFNNPQQICRAGRRQRQDKPSKRQPLFLCQQLALPKVNQPCAVGSHQKLLSWVGGDAHGWYAEASTIRSVVSQGMAGL